MLSIEYLIVNAVKFITRFLYTLLLIVVAPCELVRYIDRGRVQLDVEPNKHKILTNPHVFFLVSQILMFATFSALIKLQSSVSPVSYWDIKSGRLIHEVGSNLLEENFLTSLLFAVPISFFVYFIKTACKYIFSIYGRKGVLFDCFFLYWYSASLLLYIFLLVLVPNLLASIMSFELESNLVLVIYLVKFVVFLFVPSLVMVLRNEMWLAAKFLLIGIFSAWAIELYLNMFMYVNTSLEKDRGNEIFVRSSNIQNGSELCVTTDYQFNSVNLSFSLSLREKGLFCSGERIFYKY